MLAARAQAVSATKHPTQPYMWGRSFRYTWLAVRCAILVLLLGHIDTCAAPRQYALWIELLHVDRRAVCLRQHVPLRCSQLAGKHAGRPAHALCSFTHSS